MKKRLIAAAALVFVGISPTGAQDRSDFYRSGYFLLGMYLRASVVCNNKSFVEYGFSLVGSKEFRAFSAAYPQTLEEWMREGGENFNRGVMKSGIFEACKYMQSQTRPH